MPPLFFNKAVFIYKYFHIYGVLLVLHWICGRFVAAMLYNRVNGIVL